MKDTNYTIQTSKDNYVTYTTSKNKKMNEVIIDGTDYIEFKQFYKAENEKLKQALEEIKNDCVEILATIAEEGKPNHSIVDTIWCKNIPCCTLWELVEGMQREINEVLTDVDN